MPKKDVQAADRLEATDRRRKRDLGATIMEYALIVSAIALVAVIGVTAFGLELRELFDSFLDSI